MKTQINNLRTGKSNLFKNKGVDYHLAVATSIMDSFEIWDKIIDENPSQLHIKTMGIEINLKGYLSKSGKTTVYMGTVNNEHLHLFDLTPSKKGYGKISIQNANCICIDNGKNDYKNICPSLIEIL